MNKRIVLASSVATISIMITVFFVSGFVQLNPEWRLVKEINVDRSSWQRYVLSDGTLYWSCTTDRFITTAKWRFSIKTEDLAVELQNPGDFPTPIEHHFLAARLVQIDGSELWTAWELSQKTNWNRIVSMDETGEFCFIIVSFATFEPQVTITIEELR